jgi:multidrug efflux pump subunit AcrB
VNKIIEFFIKNRVFGDILTVFIILIGIVSLTQIRRDAFPNVKFDVISIGTTYPGASAEGVEKLVTNPIEQDVREIDGIKRMDSASVESRSQITIQLDPDETTEQKALEDIKSIVDAIDFPEDVEDPKVSALETKNQPILQVALSGDLPELELRALAKQLETTIEEVKGVAKVNINGLRDLEIQVDLDPQKLIKNSISIDEVVNALRLQNKSIPAGTLDPDKTSESKSERLIRTIGEFENADDVANTVVRANELGQSIRVKDLGRVSLGLEEADILRKSDGVASLGLVVAKKEKADAITVVEAVRKVVEEFRVARNLGDKVGFAFIDDMSEYVKKRLSVLSSNMIVGIILVMVLLPLFLPFRVSIVVSMGIFISFFGTMAFFNFAGYSLNLLSLLGFIIVSGMLVDDAIVATENISRHLKNGLSPKDAAIKGTQEIWAPIAASVMTTVVAFLPMMFMSGIFGKFVREIPLGVVIALMISLFESILLVPQHMTHWVKATDFDFPQNPRGFDWVRVRFLNYWDNKVTPWYVRTVDIFVRKRYWVMGGLLGLVMAVVLAAQIFLKFILFPPEGIEIFFVRFTAPVGTTIEENFEKIIPYENTVKELPKNELKNFVTTIGLIQQDPNDPATKRGPEYAQIAVYLTADSDRTRDAQTIIDSLKAKFGESKDYIDIKFERVRPGPPVGKPVSLGVQGKEYDVILPAVAELKKMIESVKGIREIEDSFIAGKPELQIIPIPSEAAAAGLDVSAVGVSVRAAVDGLIPTYIQKLDEQIDVRVRFEEENKTPSEIIEFIKIPNRSGNLVPLKSIAKISEEKGITIYEHRNNQREVKVTGDIDTEVNSSTAANDYIREKILPEFSKLFPNIKVVFGGEDEDTQESLKSLIMSFAVAVLGIFLILVLTFKNLLQPFLVLLTIPVGVIAVIGSLILAGLPLSFMASLGIIALAGVIVNNAIVLVDFVNQQRSEGVSAHQSILDAAGTRLRPIFLTTCTTLFGLAPTMLGIGGTDKFILPIAFSLGYGLGIGSILTAFVFPAAIAVLDDIQGLLNRWFKVSPKH